MSYSSRVYRHRNAHTHENDNENDRSSFFSKADKKGADGKKSKPFFNAKPAANIQRLATAPADEKASTDEERMKKDKDIQTKPLQLKCAECEEEGKEDVQTKREGGGGTASAELSSRISNSAGGGNKLPKKTLNEMQSTFGANFSNVNVHTDSESAAMNRELGSKAFTHGNDIYFNSGKFNPDSSSGKSLLAHELTHVVQQGGAK